MSVPHHGENGEQLRRMQRLVEQMNRTARREYPGGRMGAEDDGELSYALANDDRHRTIVMRFGKPVEWVAFNVESAEELLRQLAERVNYLKGVRV